MLRKKRKWLFAAMLILVLSGAVFCITKFKSGNTASSDPERMIQRIETAMGDDFKKQTMTEIAATLVYSNGKESDNINYHILETTYYEADPHEVKGLNENAFHVLFIPEAAVSCEKMKVQDWDAALYKTSNRNYLCWTFSPEISYVLEYNPEAISDEEIIKMAQSVQPISETSELKIN